MWAFESTNKRAHTIKTSHVLFNKRFILYPLGMNNYYQQLTKTLTVKNSQQRVTVWFYRDNLHVAFQPANDQLLATFHYLSYVFQPLFWDTRGAKTICQVSLHMENSVYINVDYIYFVFICPGTWIGCQIWEQSSLHIQA